MKIVVFSESGMVCLRQKKVLFLVLATVLYASSAMDPTKP